MALVGFIDPDVDLDDWAERPEDPTLGNLLATAFEKLEAWAPKPLPLGTPEDPFPARYKYAQMLLTQHLWARKRAGDGEGFGADGYMISTYPLVREAFDAIRPKRSPLAGLL
jgi:hypothetical protein